MFVCTLALPAQNWLIRVDCSTSLMGYIAKYERTDHEGGVESYNCVMGPDTHEIGVPTMAVLELVRDLHFADVEGRIYVVQSGAINQDDLNDILNSARPAYEIRNLATSGALQ